MTGNGNAAQCIKFIVIVFLTSANSDSRFSRLKCCGRGVVNFRSRRWLFVRDRSKQDPHVHEDGTHPFLPRYPSSKAICSQVISKVSPRRNRGFYCRSYCLLNMFRASPCPSSGAQEYYTVVAACGILCCGFFK